MKNKLSCLLWASVCVGMLLTVTSCEKMNLSKGSADDDANVVIRIRSFEQTPFRAETRAEVGDLCDCVTI